MQPAEPRRSFPWLWTAAVVGALGFAFVAFFVAGDRLNPGSPSLNGQSEPSRTPVAPPAKREPAQVVASPRVVLETSPATIVRVEVVSTPEERARGLMFRRRLDADAGMLFLFEEPEHLSFWMKNTYLPLDMIFITSDFRVLGVVENAEPHTESSREVPGDSQYVLEVNAGFVRSHGLSRGTRVRFEGVNAL